MKIKNIFSGLLSLVVVNIFAVSSYAAILTFNSSTSSENSAKRSDWLSSAGVGSPQYLVDFESGFVNNQNVSALSGIFPGGLVITDTSSSNSALVKSGASVFGGSNPVGVYSLLHNERSYLELNFSSSPVDYVGLMDIDHAGTSVIVSFVGGGTASTSLDGTGTSGNSAEFFGIYRNDMPKITLVKLDASGDGKWGIDNIEYGVPEPGTLVLLASGLLGILAIRRKK